MTNELEALRNRIDGIRDELKQIYDSSLIADLDRLQANYQALAQKFAADVHKEAEFAAAQIRYANHKALEALNPPPEFGALKARLGELKDELHSAFEPELRKENEKLRTRFDAAMQELQQNLRDFRSIASMHASDYAHRRAFELNKRIGEI